MTYCLAIKIDRGLVFCSDSRTNAGADRVSAYSKMHRFSMANDRQIVMLSAGNLGTTQAVMAAINRDIQDDSRKNISKAAYLEDVVDYVGELSLQTRKKYNTGGANAGFDASATFILGGQIKGQPPELYMIYPEGNHITASEQHPFLQIGETKYGKPILDRIVRSSTDHETAMRCALVSMDSTMRSNATVGPPIELLYCPKDKFEKHSVYLSFEDNNEFLVNLRRSWDEKICEAFNQLPKLGDLIAEKQKS